MCQSDKQRNLKNRELTEVTNMSAKIPHARKPVSLIDFEIDST